MFTGITRGYYPITFINKSSDFSQIAVSVPPEITDGLQRGASVAIDGVCLTVVNVEGGTIAFDVMQETLNKTTLGNLSMGSQVNVERSYKVGDEIGGHILSGHVFGTAKISKIVKTEMNHTLTIQCNPEWMKYILPKGFIALDGVSLTICDCDPDGHFTINLIPETLKMTTFGFKKEGDNINLELDAKTQATVDTVERVLQSQR